MIIDKTIKSPNFLHARLQMFHPSTVIHLFFYIHLTGFKEENVNVSTQLNCDYGFHYNRASPVSVDASILCCLLRSC